MNVEALSHSLFEHNSTYEDILNDAVKHRLIHSWTKKDDDYFIIPVRSVHWVALNFVITADDVEFVSQ